MEALEIGLDIVLRFTLLELTYLSATLLQVSYVRGTRPRGFVSVLLLVAQLSTTCAETRLIVITYVCGKIN